MIKRIAPALVFLTVAIPALAFAAVPDPAADPAESASLLWSLYKAGHLVPMLIVASFFALKVAEKYVGWLKTGWRKLALSALFAGLAMIVERAAEGTTPNRVMLIGAVGAVLTFYFNGKGEPAQDEAN